MRIFYDVDTQNDFMKPDGRLAVPGAEAIIPNLRALTKFARAQGIRVFGSVCRHFGTAEYRDRETELKRWGGQFDDHCMDGTQGQKKIPGTLIAGVQFIQNAETDEQTLLRHLQAPQVIFEKQSFDCFHAPDNPGGNCNIADALRLTKVTEAVVYGVATDYCVKMAVMSLRKRGVAVALVTDAIAAVEVKPGDGAAALEAMRRAGATLVTAAEVTGS